MRVKETKSGKYKITGLTRDMLAIIKEVLDYMDDDLVIASMERYGTINNSGLLTKAEYIIAVSNKLFTLIDDALDGDD